MSTYLVLLLIAALAVLIYARLGGPLPPREGKDIHWDHVPEANRKPASPDILKIASFNIQYGRGLDQQLDLNRTASVISGCDLVALQEVDGPGLLATRNQARKLAQILSMGWLFAPTRTRWFMPYCGNGLLSRLPVANWHSVPLANIAGRSYRNMLVCDIEFDNQNLTVINTHLHTRQGREQQLEQVFAEFTKHERAVLLGDFNTPPGDPQLIELIKNAGASDVIGKLGSGKHLSQRVDWILTKGLNATHLKIVEPGASDHPAWLVSVRLA